MILTYVIDHINEDLLWACFHELDGQKAKGSDDVDKLSYGI